MKLLKYSLFVLVFLYGSVAFSQTPAEANAYFESGDYQLASEAYQNLLKKKSRRANTSLYHFRLAYSASKLNDMETAIEHYKKAASKYPKSNFYLGEIYFDHYYFQEAADAYSDYLAKPESGDTLIYQIEKKQKQAEHGARFLRRVEDVAIIDSIVVDKDEFIKKMRFSDELGMLTQRNEFDGVKNYILSVFTTQRGDRQYFAKMEDGNIDLFTKFKLLDDWTEATPLTDLNTDANENFPFLMLDGVTLYFASDSEESMGGYDIFITRLNTFNNTFLKPENVGMPFNSPFNDYMMVIDELNKVGWFVSDRYLPEGKVAVYQFIPNAEKKIVQSEDIDFIIDKARITKLEQLDDEMKIMMAKTTVKTAQNVKRIFINDNVSYADAADFKSNEARNLYYQLEKLKDEIEASELELEELRVSYAKTRDENNRRAISSKIYSLEARLREIKPQIKIITVKMRNEEIKSFQ